MIKFKKDKVLLLHQLMAQATGGDVGVRDEALLESAIENIYATFDGIERYPLQTVALIITIFSNGFINIRFKRKKPRRSG